MNEDLAVARRALALEANGITVLSDGLDHRFTAAIDILAAERQPATVPTAACNLRERKSSGDSLGHGGGGVDGSGPCRPKIRVTPTHPHVGRSRCTHVVAAGFERLEVEGAGDLYRCQARAKRRVA